MKRTIQIGTLVLSLFGCDGCESETLDELPDAVIAEDASGFEDATSSEDAFVSADAGDLEDAGVAEDAEIPQDAFDSEDASSPIAADFFGPDRFMRIADGEGGFPEGELDAGDRFARDHDQAGDINGDGVTDLIVGARSDDDGGTDRGAAYVLFMNADGSVASHQKISDLEGGFSEPLIDGNFFGYGVAGIGDYDGDDIPDVAVSALGRGNTALYILHLNRDGTVKSMVKNDGLVGQGLSAMDLNEDGKLDLVAADPNAAGGGLIRLVFFDEESVVIDEETVTIGEGMGGFGEGLEDGDSFGGRESALLGDIDGDGTLELAVGAFQSEDGIGAIWILSLDAETFEVVDKRKVGPGFAGFEETIPNDMNNNGTTGGHFGHAMVAPGDINGDGVPDLITGANQFESGVGYVLYLNADKTVRTYTRINEGEGGFDLVLGEADRFSRSMALVDRTDTGFTVNMGGGVSVGGSGAIYALTFHACSIDEQEGETFWSGGTTLFSNWNHGTQTVTGAMSYEQCLMRAFELGGSHITAKALDGRCIIKDESAVLTESEEGSQAYIRRCP
ncbi:MAG: integrin alpha [Polyangiales bacterium]